MKIHQTKNRTALLVALFLTAIMFNSCKKNTNENGQNDKQKAIDAAIQLYGKITAPVIFDINQNASIVSYKNSVGQIIPFSGSQFRSNAVCGQYTCGTAPSASDLYVTYYLDYVKWYYTCGGGHDLTATWRVSVPYTLLL